MTMSATVSSCPLTGVYYLMLTVNAPVASPSRHRIMLNANTTALEVSRSTINDALRFQDLCHYRQVYHALTGHE
jgi:hypothetical protein